MSDVSNKIPMYLDQNVLSAMQKERDERDEVLSLLCTARYRDVILAYSKIHTDECRNSGQPAVFVEIIEDVSAHLIEYTDAACKFISLSPRRAAAIILYEDITDKTSREIARILVLIQFLVGWLVETDAQKVKNYFIEHLDAFWVSVAKETPPEMCKALAQMKDKAYQLINTLPLDQLLIEAQEAQSNLLRKLPENYAQLDAKSDSEVADYIISCLDENDRAEIINSYPRNFWRNPEKRKEGDLTAFAFMLCIMGLVRDKRARTKSIEHRIKHFLGQFRDCQHIEQASRCRIFLTFDKGAARLAKAVYAYAGVNTHVELLRVRMPEVSQ